jgi:glycine cleavage system aminomethyltransferase T
MGYVQSLHAEGRALVRVNVRGKMTTGKIEAFPLYDPEKYGYKRKNEKA